DSIKGKRIAFTTTNGTLAIARSEGAKQILIGSFLNLSALTEHLTTIPHNVLVVCAAWKGKVNLEDTLFAGALVEKLKAVAAPSCDAPLMAQRLYRQAKDNMVDYLKESSHVKRLARLNIHKDIEFCLTPDRYTAVPKLMDRELTL
ncbi:MAG TPA: 2-phosphosulfolactate phosphatase, partial [Chryseosolibacter sp.]|nr:2-phosphosulfolactate phosphatase [Chryseosolibacter sp.]